ncbi:PR domain zinc finger protein [Trichinella pseudospiralis]
MPASICVDDEEKADKAQLICSGSFVNELAGSATTIDSQLQDVCHTCNGKFLSNRQPMQRQLNSTLLLRTEPQGRTFL